MFFSPAEDRLRAAAVGAQPHAADGQLRQRGRLPSQFHPQDAQLDAAAAARGYD